MERKTVKFEVKEVDEEAGVFTGYAATFSDRPDSWGDIIDKGAFKKTLKEAVAAGQKVTIYAPGMGSPKQDGIEYLEGPHYPAPHIWYARVTMRDGCIIKVK